MDKDQDGWVSPEELEMGLLSLGLKDATTAHMISELLTENDDNEDGKINYNEFIALSGNPQNFGTARTTCVVKFDSARTKPV